MADISKLKVPAGLNGALVEYDVKDTVARSSIPAASSSLPQAPGTAAVGTSTDYARADHVHQGYSNATTTTAGLMSAADKAKLDGVSSIIISDTEPSASSEATVWIDPSPSDPSTILTASEINAAYLSYAASQTLTSAQQVTALTNLGMGSFQGITLTTVKTISRTV